METRLNKENEVVVEGYKWFGHNRKHLHKKAVRGFSGVRAQIGGEFEVLQDRDPRGRCGGCIIGQADPEGVSGASVGSLLHSSRVLKLWEECHRDTTATG